MSRLRWKLSKIWKCSIDDEKFDNINVEQLYWYATMIYKDEEEELEKTISYLEYLASFSNPERVKKVKEKREKAKEHKFLDDQEFEKFAKEFKENEYVNLFKKINANNGSINKEAPKKAKNKYQITSLKDLL